MPLPLRSVLLLLLLLLFIPFASISQTITDSIKNNNKKGLNFKSVTPVDKARSVSPSGTTLPVTKILNGVKHFFGKKNKKSTDTNKILPPDTLNASDQSTAYLDNPSHSVLDTNNLKADKVLLTTSTSLKSKDSIAKNSSTNPDYKNQSQKVITKNLGTLNKYDINKVESNQDVYSNFQHKYQSSGSKERTGKSDITKKPILSPLWTLFLNGIWPTITILALIVIAYFLYITYLNFFDPDYIFYRYIYIGARTILFKNMPRVLAERQAADRRNKIIQSGILLTIGDNVPEQISLKEFLEAPPLLENDVATTLESEEAIGHEVRIAWQLDSIERLLTERLVDTIVYFHRKSLLPEPKVPVIRCLKKNNLRNQYLNWCIVIETQFPDKYIELLSPYKDWLAVNIEFLDLNRVSRSLPVTHGSLGKCISNPGGNLGTLGGLLKNESSGLIYGMTCNHVLSSECKCRMKENVPNNYMLNLNPKQIPDAALIDDTCCCFKKSKDLYIENITICAQESDIDDCIAKKTPIKKIYPSRDVKTKGFVKYTMATYELNGVTKRFPCLNVRPQIWIFAGIIFPLFDRKLSRPGDSGSWLIIEEKNDNGGKNKWIGMIAGGDPNSREVYVLEAASLLDHFEKRDNAKYQLIIKNK
jgi:hypothetical protein